MNDNIAQYQSCLVWTVPEYPEFPYGQEDSHISLAMQSLFELNGLARDNPFSKFIKKGQTALIKPNWVRDYNPDGYFLDSLITHSSIIAALIEFLARAMEGEGAVVIADAPLQNCKFEDLMKKSRMKELIELFQKKYPRLNFIIEDWRLTRLERVGLVDSWRKSNLQTSKDDFGDRDTNTHEIIDLGKRSFLEDISDYADRFRVTRYKPSLTQKHHAPNKHEYLVTRRVSECDFLINVAKMKTHIKAGITGAMKNLVGINGHKEFLPHHIKGAYFEGGDNYCLPNRFRRWYEDRYDQHWENFSEFSLWQRKKSSLMLRLLWKLSQLGNWDSISAGNWRGNDTVWRMTLDLNHWLYFYNSSRPPHIFNIIDGIVAGEGEGPLRPSPKPLGAIIGGTNPAYVDAVMAQLMGYNISRVSTVYEAIYHRRSLFAGPYLEDYEVMVKSEKGGIQSVPFQKLPNCGFKKPRYWRGADRI